ncbi:MAG: site-2 protease family protein [Candidatus Bathyarchaeia archaeon]
MSEAGPPRLAYRGPYSLSELKTLVGEQFDVQDAFLDVAGIPTFIVRAIPVKDRFKTLTARLGSLQLLPILRHGGTGLILKVFNKPPVKADRRSLSIVLLVVTLFTIYIAGYILWTENELWSIMLMPKASPYFQAALYTTCLAGIIGSHELGHKIACNRHGLTASTPYFIPGFPPFGTFGALISLKDPPTNRDELFDIGVAGALSGFLTLMIVTVLSMALGVHVPETQVKILEEKNLVGPVMWPSSPLVFSAIFWLAEVFGVFTSPQGWTLILAQILFAAWVGSLVTFLNLLPIWQLDGGHVARAVFGSRGHRFASVIGLTVLVVSGYWFFALFLVMLMTASRQAWAAAEPLENISPLSRGRRASYSVVILIIILCFVAPPR